jgi:hypothetical protein
LLIGWSTLRCLFVAMMNGSTTAWVFNLVTNVKKKKVLILI